jgi:hypothetical protein
MDTNQNHTNDFELSSAGTLYNLLQKVPFLNSQKRIAVLGIGITWLPIVILCGINGTLYSGVQMPFLSDVAMQARLLLALPFLIIFKTAIENKVKDVLTYMSIELLDAEDRQQLVTNGFRRARQLSNSALAEIVMFVIVIIATVSLVKGGVYSTLEEGTTSWMVTAEDNREKLSMAGYWAVLVSIPIIQLLILRWLGYYIVWVLFLLHFSKAKIKLIPTHADKAGGLGILILAQRSFNLFFVAITIIFAGELTATLLFHPETFDTIRSEGIAFIVVCLFLLIFPLTFFSGKLLKIKNEGLLQLGNLSADLSRKFEREWVNDTPVDKILVQKEIDPSLVYDYSEMYASLQELRVIPITLRDIAGMAFVLFLPFVPIIFIHFSVAELLQKVAGILL